MGIGAGEAEGEPEAEFSPGTKWRSWHTASASTWPGGSAQQSTGGDTPALSIPGVCVCIFVCESEINVLKFFTPEKVQLLF